MWANAERDGRPAEYGSVQRRIDEQDSNAFSYLNVLVALLCFCQWR